MRTKLLGLTISASVLASCTPHIAGTETPPSAMPRDEVYYDTQTIVGPCTDAAEAVPLVAAVASAVIAQGVNRIGDAIKAAAEKETQVVTARRNVELTNKGLGPCVTVARGWFHRAPPAFPPTASSFLAMPGSLWPMNDPPSAAQLWQRGLHLAGTPDFFFQGRVAVSTDGSAYTVLPVMALLERPISSTPLRPSGNRSVLVSFAFSEVGKAVDLQKGGGTTLVIGKMEPGQLRTFSDVNCFSTDGSIARDARLATAANPEAPAWMCPEAGKFNALIRSPFESEWFSVTLGEKSKPMLVQALVSETRSPSQFLAFVADVFGATKGALTEDLQQALIPSVGAAADETALAAQEKAESEADTAMAKAITDLRACVTAPTDAAKRAAARVSLRAYMQAARKAERGSAVHDDHVSSISITGTESGPCQSALDAVLTG